MKMQNKHKRNLYQDQILTVNLIEQYVLQRSEGKNGQVLVGYITPVALEIETSSAKSEIFIDEVCGDDEPKSYLVRLSETPENTG